MDRAAQLEAAIAEAPERREPYLVYADYLLEQGDRRGTLIMEHAAGNARQALARELALQRDDVEQTWFMGFIETARIKSERPLYALEELFAHPSGKFIQQLAFDRATPGLVPFLIAHAPKTLARVQVGPVGMWTPPSELVEAFPRMRVGIELARAAERAKSQRLGTGISPGALPAFPDLDTASVLKGLRAELEKQRPIGMVDALKTAFPPDVLDAFAFALAKQWRQHDSETWAFQALGRLGGDATARFLGKHFADFSHARAVQAVGLLAMIGSPVAITEIAAAWSTITRYRPRREEARRVLEQLADRQGLPNAMQLLLRNCPLDADASTQRWFLHEMMLVGTRLSPAELRTYVVEHPARAALAKSLLWAAYDHEHELVQLFTTGKEPRGDLIGVVHPIELDQKQRTVWAARMPEQAILQLARPVFAKLTDYAREPIGRDAAVARLAERDWYVAEQGDRGVAIAMARDFHRDGISAFVLVGDNGLGQVGVQTFHGDRRRVKDLHPVTRSEIAFDLEYAVGHTGEKPIAALVEELAKTGRATCVVCGQPIAKGTPRVGVERMISTEQFTGRGMVWAHDACRSGLG